MTAPLDISPTTRVDLTYETGEVSGEETAVEVVECTPDRLHVVDADGEEISYAWTDLVSIDRTNPKSPPEAFAPLEIDNAPTADASDGGHTGPEAGELPRTGPLPRPEDPDAAKLMLDAETFDAPDRLGVVRFWTDEFTSICPRTGQPDYNEITIEYVPSDGGKCIESKALKYYLWSFREHGAFTESLATRIAADVHFATEADAVRVTVHQQKRGGITLDAVSHRGEPYLLPVADAPTR